MPNISPDQANGIGGWTTAQFVRAIREGVSANGQNEYPAFPYTSLQRMTANDLRDLLGFIKTLPAVAGKARDNDLKFPFTMRRGIGLWKLSSSTATACHRPGEKARPGIVEDIWSKA